MNQVLSERHQRFQERINQLYSRTIKALVPICIRGNRGEPELVGTAIALKVDDRVVLATAAHVADHGLATKLYAGLGDQLWTLPPAYLTSLPPSGTREDDATDLGLWVLGDSYREKFANLNPINVLQSDLWAKAPRTLEPGSDYIVIGYPRSRQARQPRESSRGYELEFKPEVFTVRPYPADIRATAKLKFEDSLFLDYDKNDSYHTTGRQTGPDLHGVSGSPVWYIRDMLEPECGTPMLAGIAIAWRKKPPVGIIATPMIHLISGIVHALEEKS